MSIDVPSKEEGNGIYMTSLNIKADESVEPYYHAFYPR
jgi:hypothetical protein